MGMGAVACGKDAQKFLRFGFSLTSDDMLTFVDIVEISRVQNSIKIELDQSSVGSRQTETHTGQFQVVLIDKVCELVWDCNLKLVNFIYFGHIYDDR